ncbi:M20/M25/M40 family metallo-hydrolase [Candidatus Thiosymbion oneisti]|uniref:M20/M25/M40 family metallo-hydrolase n=1 Tax=Candidatus Thiosymbion oneisti TaxID=589554 RepID=UPI000AFBC181|nr:M20/M25/M40 family metallo-hydrolase [Candidatus Thiosymbion oneisti]
MNIKMGLAFSLRCIAVAALLISLLGCTKLHRPNLACDYEPPPLALASALRASVTTLATDIGERHCWRAKNLEQAATWIEGRFKALGLDTKRLPVYIPEGSYPGCCPLTLWNVEATKIGGRWPQKSIIVGAHYDSKVATPGWKDHEPLIPDQLGTPGADDNASGVAALLALAKRFSTKKTERSIRFVAFVNEEPPFFKGNEMGSSVYARKLKDRGIEAVGMVSLETLGIYSHQSQHKRLALAGLIGLPARPDYVAFLGNQASRSFIDRCAEVFHAYSKISLRTFTLYDPAARWKPWSDDWSFWKHDIPAFSVTDTAFLRHDHYHEISDTPDRLDYETMAHVVWGLGYMLDALANPSHDNGLMGDSGDGNKTGTGSQVSPTYCNLR